MPHDKDAQAKVVAALTAADGDVWRERAERAEAALERVRTALQDDALDNDEALELIERIVIA